LQQLFTVGALFSKYILGVSCPLAVLYMHDARDVTSLESIAIFHQGTTSSRKVFDRSKFLAAFKTTRNVEE